MTIYKADFIEEAHVPVIYNDEWHTFSFFCVLMREEGKGFGGRIIKPLGIN